jgi:tRNA threonylcarbamoyladenosine biosynthesis protein TsaB
MAYILHIDTSESICSVALSANKKLIGIKESFTGHSHASMLTVLIVQLFQESHFEIKKLAAVSVSMGPGSYTGLRIGVSAAKGICYALNIPLIGINTLKALASGFIQSPVIKTLNIDSLENTIICPMIDARRMEVFMGLYNTDGDAISETKAEIIHSGLFNDLLKSNKIIFIGSGAIKCKNIISDSNAFFPCNFSPRADYLISDAYKAFKKNHFVDSAYFEPYYLKDFVATIPKNKIF